TRRSDRANRAGARARTNRRTYTRRRRAASRDLHRRKAEERSAAELAPSSLLFTRNERRIRQIPLLEAEVDRRLLQHELLPLGGREIDAVRVDELHGVREPFLPRLLRDLVV